MRMLVLGGTVFLSRAIAVEAVRRGHAVRCACRGSATLPTGAVHMPLDRSAQDPADVVTGEFDAVVDLARHPGWVRRSLEAFPRAHWVFVSTISVYADHASPGGTPETLPVAAPIDEDVDLTTEPQAYGGMKVACEHLVRTAHPAAFIARPGLIVGPGDPTGRFTYWPARLADGGTTLAPGSPHDPVQVVDVRDLAGWLVDAAERGLGGTFDAVGPVRDRAAFLAEVAVGVDARPELVWAGSERLVSLGVEPWAGPESLPLWLPGQEYAGMLAHDEGPARAAGLVTRPLAETAADTLAWWRRTPGAAVIGISRERERELLAAL